MGVTGYKALYGILLKACTLINNRSDGTPGLMYQVLICGGNKQYLHRFRDIF